MASHPLKPGERMPKEIGPELEIPAEAPPEVLQLKQKQRNVLELLVEGLGITEAARLSAVGRTTVHRWIRDDKDFAAALMQWRQRTHESARNKLISAADLGNNSERHLVLHELIHGDHFDPAGAEDSWISLARAAELKCDFPRQVHFLPGNHE